LKIEGEKEYEKSAVLIGVFCGVFDVGPG